MVDSPNGDSRRTISVKLTEQAEVMIRSVKANTGMTQVAFIERLVEWYIGLPPVVQMHLRDKDGDAAGELVRLRLEENRDGMTIEQAMAILRRHLPPVENLSRARGAGGRPMKKAARQQKQDRKDVT